jgi:hypothetical protein
MILSNNHAAVKMKNPFNFILISIFVFQFMAIRLQAQQWEKEGEIEDAQVIIEKSRNIVLPQIPRNFEKIPPLPADNNLSLKQTYDFKDEWQGLPGLTVNPRVLKLKDEPLEKLYRGYVRAGFGNYTTPYIDGYFYNKRNKNYLAGLRFSHRSSAKGPIDKNNSGNGRTSIDLSGNYYRGPITMGGDAGYEHSSWHFYGYPDGSNIKEDSIRQSFDRFHIHGYVENLSQNYRSNFRLDLNYSNLADHYNASESAIRGNLNYCYKIRDGLSIRIFADALLTNRKDSSSQSRNLVKIRPSVFYRYENLEVNGGLNTVFQNDTLASRGSVLLYPYLDLEYHVNDWISGYLKLDGDIQEVTLDNISRLNPYINRDIALYHTDKKFGIDWGGKFSLGKMAWLNAGMEYANLKGLYFFKNDSADISRFDLVYDRGVTNLTHIYGDFNLSRTGVYLFSLKGNYYHYQVSEAGQPWHRPKWKFDLISRYNIYKKIIVSTDLYLMGGIIAMDYIKGQVITLDPITDINVNVDYLFSEKFSVFLDFQNILGKNYEQYWRYPSRGFQFMAGGSISF